MTEKPTYEELEQRIKELEQELVKRHEVEKELNLTLDATTEGIWSWKFKTNDFYFSPQYYKMLGYKPDEFSPDFENWLDLIHPDDREKSLEIANEFLKSKSDLYENEFRLRTKNDGYRWIKTVGKVVERDESGDAVYMIGNHEDITEIKSVLNALIEERERFELAMQFTNDGLFDWNLETNEVKYSSGWKRMLGYSDDEIKDEFSEWERLTKFEDMKSSVNMMNELLEGKRESFEKEFKMQHKDGHWVDILARANVVFNEYGKGVRVVGTHVDITSRKQAEIKQQELEAANLRLKKAESLGQMAGGIAHLFNNYLHVASGNLEMALENLSDDSLIHENLTETMKAVRRCSDVSGSMLTYLGQSFAQTQSLDISEFCLKNLSSFQSSIRNDISIDTNISDMELIVRANAGQMQQVLNHLITNACESIGENNGRITLTTKTISASDISEFHLFPVGYKPSADNYVCVEITDTGCGISKDDLHKISDPFFTTKFTGRGLGLAVVSGIVKSWGGCIGVKSKVGHGSTFMVFIPLSEDNSIRQSQNVAQSLQPQQKELSTVLMVDDNAAVLKMTTIMLRKMGFEVISAVNGVEAVELFKQHKESVSCLITDLTMPELDGWGTLAAIRKIKPDIPAILASGYDEAFAMSSDDASEKPQAFLHKPYTMKDLKIVLEQALLL